ncbi:hypothetical protein [Bacillus clarus]|uniref:Uncharacterized protein n=1 Tax=Bacillus clarus TaxID=2338372 RepID=A0A090YLH2_9BACI|nr:hypothetical protein [Bacillus clarus]KFM98782.1 hypothetical protein DJ93_4772 [Bacillus clarus]
MKMSNKMLILSSQEYKKSQGNINIIITDEIKSKSKQIEESRTQKATEVNLTKY